LSGGADGGGGSGPAEAASDGGVPERREQSPEHSPEQSREQSHTLRERFEDWKLDRFNRRDPLPIRDDTGYLASVSAINLPGFTHGKVRSHSHGRQLMETQSFGRRLEGPGRERGHLRIGGGRFEATWLWERSTADPEAPADHSLVVLRLGRHGYAREGRQGRTVRHEHFRSQRPAEPTAAVLEARRLVTGGERLLTERSKRHAAATDAWISSRQTLLEAEAALAHASEPLRAAKILRDRKAVEAQRERIHELKASRRQAKRARREARSRWAEERRDFKSAARGLGWARRDLGRAWADAANHQPYTHPDLDDFRSVVTAE
jgi:hypothetical protein